MLEKLTKKQADILTVVLIFLILGVIIFWINFWISLPKSTPPIVEEKPSLVEEIPEELKPGEIGEISEEEAEEKGISPLPPQIFNTSGIISKVENDRLIVQGDGTNFSDKKPRELTLIFTDSTITFELGQKIKYQGLEGLKHLKIGDSITISSSENIRGKTEFIVNYINK